MFIVIFAFVFKVLLALFKIVYAIGFVIVGFIAIGAFIAAIFKVFPVAGVILAIIVISVVVYYIAFFVKKRKVGAIHESPQKRSKENHENSSLKFKR